MVLINLFHFLHHHIIEINNKNFLITIVNVSFNTVNGSIRGLVQKGYVDERIEEVVIPATEPGKKDTVETIRYETLNEAGLAYDPEQEDREQKEREREKRKAKRNKQAE